MKGRRWHDDRTLSLKNEGSQPSPDHTVAPGPSDQIAILLPPFALMILFDEA